MVAHGAIPAIRDRNQSRIDSRAETLNQSRQRIIEVFIFSAPESMSCHHDPAPEPIVSHIKAGNSLAFARKKKTADNGTALLVEILLHTFPVDGSHAIRNALHRSCDLCDSVHVMPPLSDT